MEEPLQIVFRDVPSTPKLEASIRQRAARLERFYDRITSCRVVVEAPHHHHRKGNFYHVRIQIGVPGEELVIDREPGDRYAHEDLSVTLRDAFKAARRRLEDFARKQRGDVKTPDVPPHARVTRLVPEEGFGFLETPDGREIYFHRNSVLHDAFDRLEIGTEVSFVEEEGEKGPQARTVRLAGRHHHLTAPPAAAADQPSASSSQPGSTPADVPGLEDTPKEAP